MASGGNQLRNISHFLMTAASPSSTPPAAASNQRRSSLFDWRFSIRELLLLTTAVAALVALVLERYEESRPYQPSAWIQRFGQSQHLEKLAVSAGHTKALMLNGGGGGGGSGQMHSRQYQYRFELPQHLRGQFMEALVGDARQGIAKEEGQVRSTSSSGPDGDRGHIGLQYEAEGKRGVVEIHRVDVSDEQMLLLVWIYEHRADR